jgi:hypothetical protein
MRLGGFVGVVIGLQYLVGIIQYWVCCAVACLYLMQHWALFKAALLNHWHRVSMTMPSWRATTLASLLIVQDFLRSVSCEGRESSFCWISTALRISHYRELTFSDMSRN